MRNKKCVTSAKFLLGDVNDFSKLENHFIG